MKFKKVLLNNLGLKVLALFLAFVTWFSVEEVIKVGGEKTALQKLLTPAKYSSKKLTVKAVFVGNAPEGFKFLEEAASVSPGSVLVVGPARVLAQKEYIYTAPIDLSEHTKSKTIDVDLESISRAIKFPKTKVQVSIPIEKIEE